MALTRDTRRQIASIEFHARPVAAATRIFQGGYLGTISGGASGGCVRPLVAGDLFAGIASTNGVDNTDGAAAERIADQIDAVGELTANVVGVTGLGNVGDAVYATSDDDLTLTASGGSLMGRITGIVSGTLCKIRFVAHTHLQPD